MLFLFSKKEEKKEERKEIKKNTEEIRKIISKGIEAYAYGDKETGENIWVYLYERWHWDEIDPSVPLRLFYETERMKTFRGRGDCGMSDRLTFEMENRRFSISPERLSTNVLLNFVFHAAHVENVFPPYLSEERYEDKNCSSFLEELEIPLGRPRYYREHLMR